MTSQTGQQIITIHVLQLQVTKFHSKNFNLFRSGKYIFSWIFFVFEKFILHNKSFNIANH